MRRTRIALLLAILMVAFAAPTVSAHGRGHHGSGGWWWHHGALPGVLPPWVRLHGHSVKDFASDYLVWGFGKGEGNPLLEGKCEQSPLDPKVWYLPVSLGPDTVVTCDIPKGAFLFLSAGGSECSNVEDPPWYGADAAGLKACVDTTFKDLTYAEFTIRGRTSSHLKRYIVTTRVVPLPPDNLLSADPAISMMKGFFMLIAPPRPGSHVMRAYDEWSDGFIGAVSYTLNVH